METRSAIRGRVFTVIALLVFFPQILVALFGPNFISRKFAIDPAWNILARVPQCESTQGFATLNGENKLSLFLFDNYAWRSGQVRRENYFFLNNFDPALNLPAKSYLARWCASKGFSEETTAVLHLECHRWNPSHQVSSVTHPFQCGALS